MKTKIGKIEITKYIHVACSTIISKKKPTQVVSVTQQAHHVLDTRVNLLRSRADVMGWDEFVGLFTASTRTVWPEEWSVGMLLVS